MQSSSVGEFSTAFCSSPKNDTVFKGSTSVCLRPELHPPDGTNTSKLRPVCRLKGPIFKAEELLKRQDELWSALHSRLAAPAAAHRPMSHDTLCLVLRDAKEEADAQLYNLISLFNLSESARFSAEHRSARYVTELSDLKRRLAPHPDDDERYHLPAVHAPLRDAWAARLCSQRAALSGTRCLLAWRQTAVVAAQAQRTAAGAGKDRVALSALRAVVGWRRFTEQQRRERREMESAEGWAMQARRRPRERVPPPPPPPPHQGNNKHSRPSLARHAIVTSSSQRFGH
jgi:hypothetical protein